MRRHSTRVEQNVVQGKTFFGVHTREDLERLDGDSITSRSCGACLLDIKADTPLQRSYEMGTKGSFWLKAARKKSA